MMLWSGQRLAEQTAHVGSVMREPTARSTTMPTRTLAVVTATVPVELAQRALPTTVPTPAPTATAAATATTAPVSSPVPSATPSQAELQVAQALARLTSDEDLVGQLLLLGWRGNTAAEARQTIAQLKPGGIVYVDNTRARLTATNINRGLNEIARAVDVLPPIIAVDHEGGTVQRIQDVPNLGSNLQFARSNPTDLAACQRGLDHATALRAMGFSMNLAPVLDVNNNPQNPVIGVRSYSADPQVVARLGAAYIRGLQTGGIIAVGKHFPGHGNTSVDSHLQLPVLPQTVEEMEDVELVPFRRALQRDVDLAAIMSAHIVFPAVDPQWQPATLSQAIMTGLLRDRLGFKGLVLSDDMAGMRAITDNYQPGEAAVRAVGAGVDLLIIAGDLPRQVQSRNALLNALRSGDLRRERVLDAVTRVLRAKARFGLLDRATASPPAASCAGADQASR